MVARFLDGFDHYSTAQILRKWTATVGTSPTIDNTIGRFGGSALTGTNFNQGVSMSLDSQATWIVGLAIKVSVSPPTTSAFIRFLDTGTAHVDLRLTTGMQLQFTRNGTSLGTGTTVLSANTWYYIECKVTINDTTGVAAAKINGTSELNLTSQDTRNAANSTANTVAIFGGAGSASTWSVDDLYIFDGTGGANNDFNGAARIWTGLASEAGNYAQFTATPGPNFANTNEFISDDDGSYNYSSTANQIDSFKFDDPPITAGTATALQHVITAKTDGAGTRTLAAMERQSSTDYVETAQTLTSSWAMYKFLRDTNPATSAAFTASELQSDEWGYKLIS